MAVTTALTGSGVAWPRGPPRLVIADEPTGNLDTGTGAEILDLLLDLRESQGVTIVLATHVEAVAARWDQIIHLTDGRISSTS